MAQKQIVKLVKNFKKNESSFLTGFYIFIFAFLLGVFAQKVIAKNGFTLPIVGSKLSSTPLAKTTPDPAGQIDLAKLQEEVIPAKGMTLKFNWGDLGKKMIEDGVIDEKKLAQAVAGSDTLPPQYKKYMDGSIQDPIELNADNAQFWVDVLWGLGLANKNDLLDSGPMMEGGKPENFASTGGYTIGVKAPMAIYSKYSYITLTPAQQALVKEIAGGVYRPCCGNSAAFPDCNHGMAALGLIELMVSQGYSKDDIFKTVLAFNSYWFPGTYLDISYHFAKAGRDFKSVPASELVGKTFSSGQGYQTLKRQLGDIKWPALQGGKGCGA